MTSFSIRLIFFSFVMSKLDVKLFEIPYIIILCSSYIGLYRLFWKKI